MVFENVTLFEVHLDGAQFGWGTGRSTDDRRTESTDVTRRGAGGPTVGTGSGVADDSADDEGSGRGRVAKLAVAIVLVSVVATVVARRLARRTDPEFGVDSPDDVEPESYATDATGRSGHAAGPSAAGDQ